MTSADRLLIIAVLVLLPWLYLQTWSDSGNPTGVEIRVGKHAPTTESLVVDRTINVPGPLGDSVIEIKNQRARFRASPCSRKVCVHSGWLETAGALAACLPNRISIRLLGQRLPFDAINF